MCSRSFYRLMRNWGLPGTNICGLKILEICQVIIPNNPGHLHFTFVFLKCFLNQSSNSLQLLWSLYFTGNFFTSQTFVTVMIRNKETKKYVKLLRQNSVLIVCIVSITYNSQCTKMSGRRTLVGLYNDLWKKSKKKPGIDAYWWPFYE